MGAGSYVANGLNQYESVGGVAVTHDPNGNLTQDHLGRTFTYDAENILRAANNLPGGASATYRYYADGTRRSKTVDSVTSEFFTHGDQEIAEKSGGQWVRRYYRLPGSVDEPFLMVDLSSGTAVNHWVH